MAVSIDLTGQRFGRLVVIEKAEPILNGIKYRTAWLCQCDCNGPNSLTVIRQDSLMSGQTQSCGCLGLENLKLGRQPTHGQRYTRLYKIWSNMKTRCHNPNVYAYNDYGGRGITVCDDWNNFVNFQEWALNNGYDENLTIERNDVNGDYCPENCSWITKSEQSDNRRTNIMITYFNETHSLTSWCKILNLPYNIIHYRICQLHWDFWTAISTPLPAHYYDDCYDYDYSNEYYEDLSDYDDGYYDDYGNYYNC